MGSLQGSVTHYRPQRDIVTLSCGGHEGETQERARAEGESSLGVASPGPTHCAVDITSRWVDEKHLKHPLPVRRRIASCLGLMLTPLHIIKRAILILNELTID